MTFTKEAFEASGTILVYTLSPRLKMPNTMVLPPAPRPRLPGSDVGQSKIRRFQQSHQVRHVVYIPELYVCVASGKYC